MYLCELHDKALESSLNLRLITYVHSFGGCCFEINYKRKERAESLIDKQHIRSLQRTHSLSHIYLLTRSSLIRSLTHSPTACSYLPAHPCALRCPALGLSRAPALSSQSVWLTHSLSPFRFAPAPAPGPDQSHRLHILLSPSPNRRRRQSCEREKKARGPRRAKTGSEIA